jgi:two-component system, sensor histidine kinase
LNKTNILIVDDYQENIDALSGLIAADDVRIFTALNADDALDLLVRYDFGLAIFDVQMPVMDGFELARLARGVKRHRHLPIIFVTAQQETQRVLFEGYESGAVDLLFKPLDPHMVRTKVRVFVELNQQRTRLQDQVEELQRLRVEADSANVAKGQFLANMSHEIRTPLAAVMGFADLIIGESLSEKERAEFSDAIKRNGNLLLKLIDDILDLSKIEANQVEYEKGEFDLNELLSDVESTLSFKARSKGVSLELNRPRQALPVYKSDSLRIKQVLLNIIGNAIKFSERGTVKVDTSIQQNGGTDSVRFLIADNGIGMTAEQIRKIFRPFGQADSSTVRQFGGSGLGLVISRQIARGLGGDVRLIHSQPGEGSVFEVAFKMERSAKRAALNQLEERTDESADLSHLQDKRVLAVDDSEDNLTLIQMFLRGTGVELTTAESGMRALELSAKTPFDLILMDIQMPEMDGHETTRRLRQSGVTAPILALTAHAIRTEHDRCLAAGCNAVLTKPVKHQTLLASIARHLRQKTSESFGRRNSESRRSSSVTRDGHRE